MVKVDNVTDFFIPIGAGGSLCVEASWISPLSSGFCNIRAALDFCRHRVPWLGGRVKICHIILPESTTMSSEELFYYIPAGNITISMDIIIDGAGSKIFGLKSSRFLSTKNVFVSEDDITGEIWSNFSISEFESNITLTSESKLTVKNLTFIDFGFEYDDIIEFNFNGGTMNLQNLQYISFQNVVIRNSNGYFGGGLFIADVTLFSMEFSKFDGNIARNGGGISMFRIEVVNIIHCEFENNEAYNIGGAFQSEGITSILVLQSNITSNKAKTFGGGISLSNVHESATLRLLNISQNEAIYGSAAVLSKCKRSSLIENTVSANIATGGGTIYWIAMSSMASPRNIETNTFINNSFGFYGPTIATEITKIIPDTNQLEVNTYEPDVYPLNPHVRLVDFYEQTVTSESDILVSADLLKGNAYCSYNSDIADVSGGTIATVQEGTAKFKFLRASCIPGGHINITFSTQIKSFPTEFPIYSWVCKSKFISVCSTTSKSTKVLSTNIPVTFRNCHRGEIFDFNTLPRSTCSLCTPGYSLEPNEDNTVIACQKCPAFAKACSGMTIFLREGTFRWGPNAYTIYDCMLSKGCKGGNVTGIDSCNEGYEGAMCSICSPGYFKNGNACEFCDGHESYTFSRITFFFFILGIVLTIVLIVFRQRILGKLWPKNNKIHDLKDDKLSVGTQDVTGGRANKIITDSIRTRFRLCLITFQIIIQTPSSFQISLPPIFQSLLGYLTFLNLDIGSSLPTDCTKQPMNYLQKMGVTTVIPIVLSAAVLLIYYLQTKLSGPVELDRRNHFRRKLQIQYLKNILLASYFILPSISVTILNTFVCHNYDASNEDPLNEKHLLLLSDLTVDCNSSSYAFWFIWAVVMTIIYPIGLPVLYTFLLYQYRNRIMLRDQIQLLKKSPSMTFNRGARVIECQSFAECIEFLYIGYSPEYWYWEVVEISRRLLLTAVIAVIMKGEPLQIVIAVLIALVYVKLFKSYRPFKYEEANSLLLEGQYQILFTFFILLVMRQGSIPDIPYSEDVIDASLVIINLLIIVVTVYQILFSFGSNNKVSSTPSVLANSINKKNKNKAEGFEKKEYKKDLNLAFGSDINLVNTMLVKLKDPEIEELLLEIQRHLMFRSISLKTQFIFYMPEHAGGSNKEVNFGIKQGHEVRDVESATVYLRFTSNCAKYFTFACPFERDGQRYLIVIPEEAFNVKNYPKYLPKLNLDYLQYNGDPNSLAAIQRKIMLSMEHAIPPPESAMRCFDDLFATDWYAGIGQEYFGESIYSGSNKSGDIISNEFLFPIGFSNMDRAKTGLGQEYTENNILDGSYGSAGSSFSTQSSGPDVWTSFNVADLSIPGLDHVLKTNWASGIGQKYDGESFHDDNCTDSSNELAKSRDSVDYAGDLRSFFHDDSLV